MRPPTDLPVDGPGCPRTLPIPGPLVFLGDLWIVGSSVSVMDVSRSRGLGELVSCVGVERAPAQTDQEVIPEKQISEPGESPIGISESIVRPGRVGVRESVRSMIRDFDWLSETHRASGTGKAGPSAAWKFGNARHQNLLLSEGSNTTWRLVVLKTKGSELWNQSLSQGYSHPSGIRFGQWTLSLP
jgi:hypothetical protein